MRKAVFVSAAMLILGMSPVVSHATCAQWSKLQVESLTGDALWLDSGSDVQCSAGGRQEAATGNLHYLMPAATAIRALVINNVSLPAAKPSNGKAVFSTGETKTLEFSFDSSRWESNEVTLPSNATNVTVSACVVKADFSGCTPVSIKYSRLA